MAEDNDVGRVADSGTYESGLSKGEYSEGGRFVFNIKSNDFRLVAAVQYQIDLVAVRFFGAHSEYDKVDAETV